LSGGVDRRRLDRVDQRAEAVAVRINGQIAIRRTVAHGAGGPPDRGEVCHAPADPQAVAVGEEPEGVPAPGAAAEDVVTNLRTEVGEGVPDTVEAGQTGGAAVADAAPHGAGDVHGH